MECIQITLFGRLIVCRAGQPLTLPSKVSELLCSLLLHRGRPQTREALAATLWDEADAAQAKKYLRKALWQLQQALEDDNPGAAPLLQFDGEWIAIAAEARLEVDVYRFADTCSALAGHAPQSLDTAQVASAQQALSYYQGDLLSNWYQDWCLIERERYQSRYFALSDLLMDHYAIAGQHAEGNAIGLELLRYEPTRERTHRRLMRLAFLDGDRGAALRQFERCATALERSFGISPAPATLALAAQIRAGALDEPAPTVEPLRLAALAAELTRVWDYVAVLQRDLVTLAQQITAQGE